MNFQHETVVRAALANDQKQEGNDEIDVTKERRRQKKPPSGNEI